MVHHRRHFHIAVYHTPLQLATDLLRTTWTLNTGFQLADLLLLNDSFTEDSIEEYAVYRLPEKTELVGGHFVLPMIETLTTGFIADRPNAVTVLAETYLQPLLEVGLAQVLCTQTIHIDSVCLKRAPNAEGKQP